MLCKGNPKAAPGIKPILFTQVHYHLHQRSYLHERTHKHHKQRHIHFAVLLGFFNQFQIVAVNITVLFRHSDLIPVTLNTLCKYIIQPQFIIIFKYCNRKLSYITIHVFFCDAMYPHKLRYFIMSHIIAFIQIHIQIF